jgi:lysophospholipase L1-like esterase
MRNALKELCAGLLALAALSQVGCSSDNAGGPANPGAGGSQGGAVTVSGGAPAGGAGGASTGPTSGGAPSTGGTPASGGQTPVATGGGVNGGSATGGSVTGGNATGGSATGGSARGGSATGGSARGGSATGGSATGGSGAGGTGGAATGGTTNVETGGIATGGKTGGATGATGGTATGGAGGGTTKATGGTAAGGTTAPLPIGGGLGSSDGKTPIKVWMAGDSTMAGGSSCSACPCGWGGQFDAVFNSNVTVVNNAVGGLTIQTFLYQGVSSTMDANGECPVTNTAFQSRWTNMVSPTSGMKAGDYLIIQFGINDGDPNCPKHIGEAKYLGYLNLMAKAAKDLGAEPILLTPLGAIDCAGGSTAVNIRQAYFTTATNDAGTANNVPVIDLGKLSVDLYNSLGLCPNSADYTSSSKVGQFFCQDHTHLELTAAKQIAQLVAKAIKDQGIGLAAYVL